MTDIGDDQPISKAWRNGRFGKKQTYFFLRWNRLGLTLCGRLVVSSIVRLRAPRADVAGLWLANNQARLPDPARLQFPTVTLWMTTGVLGEAPGIGPTPPPNWTIAMASTTAMPSITRPNTA